MNYALLIPMYVLLFYAAINARPKPRYQWWRKKDTK